MILPDYPARRAALARHIGPRGIAIIPTAREQQRNRDSDFLFRPDSYFYYLCGFGEPNAWLVLTRTTPSATSSTPSNRATSRVGTSASR